MFGFAFVLYLLFLLGYGAFLWAALWHLRAYRLPASPARLDEASAKRAGGPESGTERISTALVACIGILLFTSLFLFFQVPWQSYSFAPPLFL